MMKKHTLKRILAGVTAVVSLGFMAPGNLDFSLFSPGITVEAASTQTVYYYFHQLTQAEMQNMSASTSFIFVPDSLSTTLGTNDCILSLPTGSAKLTKTGSENSSSTQATGHTLCCYVNVSEAGQGFDTCNEGGIYDNANTYYCSGGGVKALAGKCYTYQQGNGTVNASLKSGVSINPSSSTTISSSQVNVSVDVGGSTYSVPSTLYSLSDNTINPTSSDYSITVRFGSVDTAITVSSPVSINLSTVNNDILSVTDQTSSSNVGISNDIATVNCIIEKNVKIVSKVALNIPTAITTNSVTVNANGNYEYSIKIPASYASTINVTEKEDLNFTKVTGSITSVKADTKVMTLPDDKIIGLVPLHSYVVESQEKLSFGALENDENVDISSSGNATRGYKYTIVPGASYTSGTVINVTHPHTYNYLTDNDDDTAVLRRKCTEEQGSVYKTLATLDINEDLGFGTTIAPSVSLFEENLNEGESIRKGSITYTDATGASTSISPTSRGSYTVKAEIVLTNADGTITKYSLSKDFEITKRAMNNAQMEITLDNTSYRYDGLVKTPVVTVKNKLTDEILVEGVDYELSQDTSATAVNSYTITITAIDDEDVDYTGSATIGWSIFKSTETPGISISGSSSITFGDPTPVYNVVGLPADIIEEEITYNYYTESEGLYTPLESVPTDAGTYYIKAVVESGNYVDNETSYFEYTINKKDVTVRIDDKSMTYGDAVIPAYTCTVNGLLNEDTIPELDGHIKLEDITVDEHPDAGAYVLVFDEDTDEIECNYNIQVDPDITAHLTVNPKEITEDMFTLKNAQGLVYNGTRYTIGYTFEDNSDYATITEDDIDQGGTLKAISAGEYIVEFVGQNNYTGYVSKEWSIDSKPNEITTLTVNGSDALEGDPITHTYDGQAPVISVETLTANQSVSYKYYKTDAGFTNPVLMEDQTAPVNAGSYQIEVTVTAANHTAETYTVSYLVSPREVTITPDPDTLSMTYGDDIPDITYTCSGVVAGEEISFKNSLSGSFTPDIPETIAVCECTISNNITTSDPNYSITVNDQSFRVNPREIKAEDVELHSTTVIIPASKTGWAIPVVEVTVNGVNLTEGEDFIYAGTFKSRIEGNHVIEVQGNGNYCGTVSVDWNAIKISSVPMNAEEVSIEKANGIGKVKYSFGIGAPEGCTVVKYGAIYSKTGALASDVTLETQGILKTEKTAETSSYYIKLSLNHPTDISSVRGYMVINDGINDYVVYSDVQSYSYTELAQIKAEEECSVVDNPVTILGDASNHKIKYAYNFDVPEGYSLVQYGAIYDKNGVLAEEVGLDTPGINKTSRTALANSYSLTINEGINDNYIASARFYMVVTDGVDNYVVYSAVKADTFEVYANIQAQQDCYIALDGPVVKTEDTVNSKYKIRFNYSLNMAEGYTLNKYGAIYSKNGELDETVSLVTPDIFKTEKTTDSSTYYINISMSDTTTVASSRGYMTFTDKYGIEHTAYSEVLSTPFV